MTSEVNHLSCWIQYNLHSRSTRRLNNDKRQNFWPEWVEEMKRVNHFTIPLSKLCDEATSLQRQLCQPRRRFELLIQYQQFNGSCTKTIHSVRTAENSSHLGVPKQCRCSWRMFFWSRSPYMYSIIDHLREFEPEQPFSVLQQAF